MFESIVNIEQRKKLFKRERHRPDFVLQSESKWRRIAQIQPTVKEERNQVLATHPTNINKRKEKKGMYRRS